MTTRFVTQDGVSLSITEVGEGLPLVFQHGLCGDAAQPAQVFPTDSEYSLLTMECRGHGASEAGPVERFSIATFASDLAAVIEAKAQAPVVVGGISMGAAIALRLAVTRPELVRAVVLARPAWLTSAGPMNMAPNKLVGELLRQHPPKEARALFEANPIISRLLVEGPDNLASLRGFFLRHPVDITGELLARISDDGPDVSKEEVNAITVPVIVIGHAQDFVHPLSYAQKLATMIPHAKLAQITPKAQDPNAYRTDFQAALSTFLKGL